MTSGLAAASVSTMTSTGARRSSRSRRRQARRKVTLLWNAADVADVVRSQLEPGIPGKFLDFPKARYGLFQMDEVRLDGALVGISTDAGYIAHDQLYMSLATVGRRHCRRHRGRDYLGRGPDLHQAAGRCQPPPDDHPCDGRSGSIPRLCADGLPGRHAVAATARGPSGKGPNARGPIPGAPQQDVVCL